VNATNKYKYVPIGSWTDRYSVSLTVLLRRDGVIGGKIIMI